MEAPYGAIRAEHLVRLCESPEAIDKGAWLVQLSMLVRGAASPKIRGHPRLPQLGRTITSSLGHVAVLRPVPWLLASTRAARDGVSLVANPEISLERRLRAFWNPFNVQVGMQID
jgi:hypothetical protein